MENIYLADKKESALTDIPASVLKHDICARLAAAAGISRLRVRDPVYELAENFNTVFDFRATLLASQKETEQNDTKSRSKNCLIPGGAGTYQPLQLEYGSFYRRFSQTALNNGKLAGAIMRDGGKTMFISCVKRALGIPMTPGNSQKVLEKESAADVPILNFAARLRFNRCVYGAASIVVDSLISADTVMELLTGLASEGAQQMLEGNDVDTYRQLFPFLSTDVEKAIQAEYRAGLRRLEAAAPCQETIEKRAVIKAGLDKTAAIINQKQQMRTAFKVKLGEMLEHSRKAQTLYSSESFVRQVTEELLEATAPPDGDEDNKGDKDDKNNKNSRNGKNNNSSDNNENSG